MAKLIFHLSVKWVFIHALTNQLEVDCKRSFTLTYFRPSDFESGKTSLSFPYELKIAKRKKMESRNKINKITK